MNKKASAGVLIFLALLGLFVYFMISKGNTCALENQHITVGMPYLPDTMNNDGECCEGLVSEAPQGFTGGAWCVKPNCQVYSCQQVGDKIGFVSICHSQVGPDPSPVLLMESHIGCEI
jgi:hypothetical protein